MISSILPLLACLHLLSAPANAGRLEANARTYEETGAGYEEMAANYERMGRPEWAKEAWQKAADVWKRAAQSWLDASLRDSAVRSWNRFRLAAANANIEDTWELPPPATATQSIASPATPAPPVLLQTPAAATAEAVSPPPLLSTETSVSAAVPAAHAPSQAPSQNSAAGRRDWLYDYALAQFTKRASGARAMLNKFLVDFPEDPRAPLVVYRLALMERDSAGATGWRVTRDSALVSLSQQSDANARSRVLAEMLDVVRQANDTETVELVSTSPGLSSMPAWQKHRYLSALQALTNGDTTEARRIMATVNTIGTDIDPIRFTYTRAFLAWQAGDTAEARSVLTEPLVMNHPLALPYMEMQAWTAYEARDLRAVVEITDRIRTLLPDSFTEQYARIHLVSLLDREEFDIVTLRSLEIYRRYRFPFALDAFMEAVGKASDPVAALPQVLELASANSEDAACRATIIDYVLLLAERDRSEEALRGMGAVAGFGGADADRATNNLVRILVSRKNYAAALFLSENFGPHLDNSSRLLLLRAFDGLNRPTDGFPMALTLLDDPSVESSAVRTALLYSVKWLRAEPPLGTEDAVRRILSATERADDGLNGAASYILTMHALTEKQTENVRQILSMPTERVDAAYRDTALLDFIADAEENGDLDALASWETVLTADKLSQPVNLALVSALMQLHYRAKEFEIVAGLAKNYDVIIRNAPDADRFLYMAAESARVSGDQDGAMLIYSDIADRNHDTAIAIKSKLRMVEVMIADVATTPAAEAILKGISAADLEAMGEAARATYLDASLAAARGDVAAATAGWHTVIARWPESGWATTSREMLLLVEKPRSR